MEMSIKGSKVSRVQSEGSTIGSGNVKKNEENDFKRTKSETHLGKKSLFRRKPSSVQMKPMGNELLRKTIYPGPRVKSLQGEGGEGKGVELMKRTYSLGNIAGGVYYDEQDNLFARKYAFLSPEMTGEQGSISRKIKQEDIREINGIWKLSEKGERRRVEIKYEDLNKDRAIRKMTESVVSSGGVFGMFGGGVDRQGVMRQLYVLMKMEWHLNMGKWKVHFDKVGGDVEVEDMVKVYKGLCSAEMAHIEVMLFVLGNVERQSGVNWGVMRDGIIEFRQWVRRTLLMNKYPEGVLEAIREDGVGGVSKGVEEIVEGMKGEVKAFYEWKRGYDKAFSGTLHRLKREAARYRAEDVKKGMVGMKV